MFRESDVEVGVVGLGFRLGFWESSKNCSLQSHVSTFLGKILIARLVVVHRVSMQGPTMLVPSHAMKVSNLNTGIPNPVPQPESNPKHRSPPIPPPAPLEPSRTNLSCLPFPRGSKYPRYLGFGVIVIGVLDKYMIIRYLDL